MGVATPPEVCEHIYICRLKRTCSRSIAIVSRTNLIKDGLREDLQYALKEGIFKVTMITVNIMQR